MANSGGPNSTTDSAPNHLVSVITVPFPAQGHLNQMLQLSCLIAAHNLPVHYVASAVHNRQARLRINALHPNDVARLHFHDLPIPPFPSPPPNPDAPSKFPCQLQPAWDASLSLRRPMADFIRSVAARSRRVVVIHDRLIAIIIQDVAAVPNAESYAFNCISAFCQAKLIFEQVNKLLPLLPNLKELPPISVSISNGLLQFLGLQEEALQHRAGDIYNTSRIIEPFYMELLDKEEEEHNSNRKNWAIGPILPAKLLTSPEKPWINTRHKCLTFLDDQDANSAIYVTFGTTTSLSDEEIREIAIALEHSEQKFIWVLRDADKADIFDGEVRRVELPEGFEERVAGRGMVVRDWAPQPEILAHQATGGFMSHCGWNSCLESITLGVPMAAWPMHSDQPANALMMTEVLKTGVLVREWTVEREVVRAPTVERAVRRLMALEEGREARRRAKELAAAVAQATEEGGISHKELESFIAHITREGSNLKADNNIIGSSATSICCEISSNGSV